MTKRGAIVDGQQDLDFAAPRSGRGGVREGAGRKKRKGSHDSPHRERPAHKARNPVHVVLRVKREIGRLRRGKVYRAIRKVLQVMAERSGFRVVHLSIQHNHLHLLVEAGDKEALSKGMQSLARLAAKAINGLVSRTGSVFQHRYHATYITSPTQCRSALAYVLNNWRRHREDDRLPATQPLRIDPFSSAIAFTGWRERIDATELGASYEPLPVAAPRTWLLREGWLERGGPRISVWSTPGALE